MLLLLQLPLLDDMVDTLLSRDSDSPVFPREEDAVRVWLASNQTFHIMRDHPAHCRFFVGCGFLKMKFNVFLIVLWKILLFTGCWGVKINQNRPAIVSEAEKMFHENHLHQYDYDQQLLIKYYQSMAAESMVYYYRGTLYELHIIPWYAYHCEVHFCSFKTSLAIFMTASKGWTPVNKKTNEG